MIKAEAILLTKGKKLHSPRYVDMMGMWGYRTAQHQNEMINAAQDVQNTMLLSSRGLGRTFVGANIALMDSTVNADCHNVVVAPTIRQAWIIYTEIYKAITTSSFLIHNVDSNCLVDGNGEPTEESFFSLKFRNGSSVRFTTIKYLPKMLDALQKKSVFLNRLIVEEFKQADEQFVYDVLGWSINSKSTNSSPFSSMLILSSFLSQDDPAFRVQVAWMNQHLNEKGGNRLFHVLTYTVDDAPEGYLDRKMLRETRDTFRDERYAIEMYGAALRTTFFSPDPH